MTKVLDSQSKPQIFRIRNIQWGLGVPTVTVSRHGCRRPSEPGMALKRVTVGTPSSQ